MKADLIITRHPALLSYLLEIGLVDASTPVVQHATSDAVRGKHVAGVLPHYLSSLCALYTEVPLVVPQELRGQELTLETVRKYAQSPKTYVVHHVHNERTLRNPLNHRPRV